MRYHQRIGWGTREVSVKIEGVTRRYDIADELLLRGIEHKTGYQTLTQGNAWEILRDQIATEKGWQIQWIFEGRASKPLLEALDEAGVPYIIQQSVLK